MSDLVSALDAVLAVDARGLSTSDQLTELEDLHRAERKLQAAIASRLVAAEATDAIAEQTGATTRGFLAVDMHLGNPAARRRLALARSLAQLPGIQAALAAGDISETAAATLTHTLLEVPDPAARDALQAALLPIAAADTPAVLHRSIAEIRLRLGLDESKEAQRQRKLSERSLTADRTFDGWVTGTFNLPPEVGAALLLALHAHAQPRGEGEDRSLAQRRADALGEIVDAHLAGADTLPDNGGERPRVVVTIPLPHLLDELADGRAMLDDRWEISPETARRLACDAEIVPAVLDAGGQPLDLGHATRVWSVAQRRAIRLRDGVGCAYGTCDHPVADIHHILPWSEGGRTDLDNAAQLCAFHHRLVHEGGWALSRNPGDGSFTFTGPHGQRRHFRRRSQPA